MGYEVLLAEDGITGWEMIKLYSPALVLLDISLPGEMDGLDIVLRVKNELKEPHPWIIAVTASAMIGDREHFLSHGCDDYMSKPFSVRELLDKVSHVLTTVPER